METIEIIDVTTIEPRLKHPLIFQKFDSLLVGDSFVIMNDHDPQPLYFQILAERGAVIDWDYIEKGPEWWKVKITRKAPKPSSETIGEIVTKDLRKASVFRKYGIDFCCGGKKSISEVCHEKKIDEQQLRADLKQVKTGQLSFPGNADEWSLNFLANYIVNMHHAYVKKITPDLLTWSKKVGSVHGHEHPETKEVFELFVAVANELAGHMVKEENILFPYIRKLEDAKNEGASIHRPGFGSVQNPINMMEQEHEFVGELIMKIQKLTNNYTPPADACNTFKALYAGLNEFADDLFLHIHLENNILFPKAERLEKELRHE